MNALKMYGNSTKTRAFDPIWMFHALIPTMKTLGGKDQ